MINQNIFGFIKKKYGHYASWAVWENEGTKPKDNIGNLSIFDTERNFAILPQLNPNVVLVGLNISCPIETPLANFHDPKPQAMDYKIRYAFRNSPYWGAYMTDIIKDFEQKAAGKVMSYLRKNKSFEEENVRLFRDELEDTGSTKPTLIAFGKDCFTILKRYFNGEFEIVQIPHYSNYTAKEKNVTKIQGGNMTALSKKKIKEPEAVDILPSSSASLIFISHDTRDAELAEAFSKLLSSVSAGVLKSFRSSDRKGSQGIEYGSEWYPELMKKLNIASDVVCLLTQRSLERPWILYEAGVAKGKLDSAVLGIVLGIPLSRANTGPFAQFQNCDDNEESLTQLVMQLVKRIPNAEPDREVIEMQVRAFRQKVSEILTAINTEADEEVSEGDASVAKLFEEVKVMFQDLPSRIENRLDPNRKRKLRRFHPMMFEEAIHMTMKYGDPVGLLIVFSYFRDEMPWLYEVGMEAYRSIKTGSRSEMEKAIKSIRMAVDFTRRGPFMEEVRDKETYFILKELPMLMEQFLHENTESSPKSKKTDKETA